MFQKILIANRGEIACRIIKTARRMGITTVAVYSAADKNAKHTQEADEAFYIGESEARCSYLNIEAILQAAQESGAHAIHPGYGFLSENPLLAQACANAQIVFIGPSVAAMEAMASKQLAKQRLAHTSVPLTPGYHGAEQSDERLLTEAIRLGFPLLIKAAQGGGGKGLRAVTKETDFLKELAGARREATAYFADDTMLLEKLVLNPRHIEVQIMADNHGHVVHLFERDCSLQRRHQKIIEEAPAVHLSATLRKKLTDAAITVAQSIDYRGAGTVEFLVDNEMFYFMEMNTRLQVEHPVTEMITGLDLVEWQLRIAANEPLPCHQEDIHAKGHAIECRIYAEDPAAHFLPSMGTIHFLKEPQGQGIRIDSGINKDAVMTQYYDPMMAKLISAGDNREEALQRLQQALKHYHIGGVTTNIPFLQAILAHPSVTAGYFGTNFLNQETLTLPTPKPIVMSLAAACFDYMTLVQTTPDALQHDTLAFQLHVNSHYYRAYLINNIRYDITLTPQDQHTLTLTHEQNTVTYRVTQIKDALCLDDGHEQHHFLVQSLDEHIVLYTEEGPVTVARYEEARQTAAITLNHQLTAPMPATVVAVLKNKGDTITTGDRLMVLEAMKMEHTIHAPNDGLLLEIFYAIGDKVKEGAELLAIAPAKESHESTT